MKIAIVLLVTLAITLVFISPCLTIWVVKDLFGVDWHGKYWQVFCLIVILYGVFGGKYSSK